MALPPGAFYISNSIINGHVAVQWQGKGDNFNLAVAEASLLPSSVGAGQWYFNRLLVKKPNMRRKGIGSALVQKLQELLAERGCRILTVEPGGYDSDPKDLEKFYAKHGFVSNGTGNGMDWTPPRQNKRKPNGPEDRRVTNARPHRKLPQAVSSPAAKAGARSGDGPHGSRPERARSRVRRVPTKTTLPE